MERTKIQNDQMFMLEDEVYSNSIIPSFKNEMWRKIELHGKVEVKGGVFGKSLNISAENIYIKGAVYCKENLHINTNKKGKLWFGSVVNAEHSILAEPGGRIRFSADLRSKKIKLNNSIVYGNVYCDELIAVNSIILGQVFAKKKLSVANSIMGSFHTGSFLLKRNMGLLLPYSISRTAPQIEGKMYNILTAENSDHIYEMGVQDIFKYPDSEYDSSQDIYILTPSMRIFDLTPFYKAIENNLKQVVYFSQYQTTDRLKADIELSKFERLFFKFLYNKFEMHPAKIISGFISLKDEVVKEFVLEETSRENTASEFSQILEDKPTEIDLAENEKEDLFLQGDVFEDELFNLPKCPECGAELENIDSDYCLECGYPLKKD